jgi:hypothetical protein
LLYPGHFYLRHRFQDEFGLQMTEQTISSLQPEQLARWKFIRYKEFERTPYRWAEIIYVLLHYPAIIVLSVILRQDVMRTWHMILITGVTYVAIAYLLLR